MGPRGASDLRTSEAVVTMTAAELLERAKGLRQRGRHQEALASAKSAAASDPRLAEAWWQIALNALDLDDTDEALLALEKTVELAPRFANGWARRSTVLLETGDVEKAKEGFERAVALDESNTAALYGLAAICRQEKDAEGEFRALTVLDESVALDSDDLNRLGILHHNAGRYGSAISYYRRVAALDSGPTGLFNLGLVYDEDAISQGADAIDTWRRVANRHPDFTRASDQIQRALPDLLELARQVRGADIKLLDPAEWYANYLSPLELLDIDPGADLDDLSPRILQQAKKILLHEIELEDGRVAWLPGVQIDRSRAIGLCDQLNDPTLLAYHYHVFRSKPLLDFLSRGDLEHFLVDLRDSPLDTVELLEAEPEGLLAWLSKAFATQFSLVFSRAVERRNVLAVECLLDGRRWVAPAFNDLCFVGAHRHVEALVQPLRNAAEKASQTKPSEAGLRLLLGADNRAAILGLLPNDFHRAQTEAASLIRSISIAAYNNHDDPDLALSLLKLSEGLALKSVALKHRLKEDTETLKERIARQRKDEASLKFGDTLAQITKDGARYGTTFIPTARVKALRWGTVINRIGEVTKLDFSLAVTSEMAQVVRISWSASTNHEAQRELFSGLINATLSYLVPTVAGKLKAQIKRGARLPFGTAVVSNAGVEIPVAGWFSTKPVVVPWSRVHSEISNGDLVIGDRDSGKTRVSLPLHETDNALILHIIAEELRQG